MMIKDEHMQDVSSRVPLPYIKEESADANAAAAAASAASASTNETSGGGGDSGNNHETIEDVEKALDEAAAEAAAAAANTSQHQQQQQQLVPITTVQQVVAGGGADASLNDSSFLLSDVPAILVQQMTPVSSRTAVARLHYQSDVLYLLEAGHVVIGRNSSTSIVHFHVGRSSFISRKHFQVIHDPINQEFFVLIVSKNGIFVDDTFQRRNAMPERLPAQCSFRFPSTDIRIEFESFLRMPGRQFVVPAGPENGPSTLQSAENPFLASSGGNAQQQLQMQQKQQQQQQEEEQLMVVAQQQQHQQMIAPPVPAAVLQQQQQQLQLKIKTQMEQRRSNNNSSPPLSPTGTLSAANSCPTSPSRQQQHHQQYAVYQHQVGGPSTSAAAAAQYQNANNGYVAVQQMHVQQDGQQLQQQPEAVVFASPLPVLAPPPPPPGHPNEFDKPLFSYAQLIVQSISASPEKQLTLSGIYSFITKHYPYYRREANKGWQNSIRHNLSLNRYFLKVERSQDEPGKGSFWRIDPNSEAKLIDQSYRKRRQRGNQNFRQPYGLPRSAPASPNHMDESREASPLHDIVLQSAPGSPDRFPQQAGQQQQQQQVQHQQMQHQQHQETIIIRTQQQPQNGNHMQIWPE